MGSANRSGYTLFATVTAIAIVGRGGSAKPLTEAEWYRGEQYCGDVKLEQLLQHGHLTAAESASVRGTLGLDPTVARRAGRLSGQLRALPIQDHRDKQHCRRRRERSAMLDPGA
jgi:hypothetical protein